MSTERPSTILSTTARGLTPVLAVVAVVITFRGHNAPGGGFAGALVVGAVMAIRFLADGEAGVQLRRVDPVVVMGLGLVLAVGTTAAPLLVGRTALDAVIWKLDVPAVGEVKVVTSMFFDLGVLLVVAGGVTAMLRSLASPTTGHGHSGRPPAGDRAGRGPTS